MDNNFSINQIVRITGDRYIRKILDIRNGEALTSGADGQIGYVDLRLLEEVLQEEINIYKSNKT